jgi:hypothetical protein
LGCRFTSDQIAGGNGGGIYNAGSLAITCNRR